MAVVTAAITLERVKRAGQGDTRAISAVAVRAGTLLVAQPA